MNVQSVLKSLKNFYEGVLGQILIVRLPDPLVMCQEPPTKDSLDEMNTLLLLILGAAVQSNQNEQIIGSIKNLPTEVQHSFVDKIKEVTDNPNRVWPDELCHPADISDIHRKDELYTLLISHLKTLVQERDQLSNQVVDITLKHKEEVASVAAASASAATASSTSTSAEWRERKMTLEVSELKAKLRGLNQDL